jgi:MYXO-CTERM domain-containing protein
VKNILTLLAATSLMGSAASVHTGLLNYWALEADASDTASSFAEATGVTADNGVVNGNTSFSAGLFGNAASFDGAQGSNITVVDGGASTGGGVANDVDRTGSDLSISVWVKANAWSTGWQGIVAHGEQSDYRIARRGSNDPVLLAYAGGTGDIQTGTTFGSAPDGDGNWHHIVAISENGVSTRLWVDGILEATGGAPNINQSNANNNLLCIGCNPDNGREFNGLIDDLAMWDRAISEDEIGLIYSNGLAGNSLASVIPEPSSALLGLLGALGLLRRRR